MNASPNKAGGCRIWCLFCVVVAWFPFAVSFFCWFSLQLGKGNRKESYHFGGSAGGTYAQRGGSQTGRMGTPRAEWKKAENGR